jgi:hypothetical protein
MKNKVSGLLMEAVSADRTDELSNSPDTTKSGNPRQSGTSSDSCSESKKESGRPIASSRPGFYLL